MQCKSGQTQPRRPDERFPHRVVCGQEDSQNSVDATRRSTAVSVSQGGCAPCDRIPFRGGRRFLPGLITGAAWSGLVLMISGITKTILEGLGYPAIYQYVAFGIGVVVEVGLVNLVVPVDHRRRPEERRRRRMVWLSYSTSLSVNV